MTMQQRVVMRIGVLVAVASLAVAAFAACGDGSARSTSTPHGAEPRGQTGSFSAADFSSLPMLPNMRPLGPQQSLHNVTTRSYEVTGYTAQGALATYGRLLSGWENSVRPHAVGSAYRGEWTRAQSHLVVSTIGARVCGLMRSTRSR